MFLKQLLVGNIETNCYIVAADNSDCCVVIDPGDNADYIMSEVRKAGYTLSGILLTHGHFDHIAALNDLRSMASPKVYALSKEKEVLENSTKNVSKMFGIPITEEADIYCEDGDVIEEAGLRFRVISTPGHTIGSVCYYIEEAKTLFSGDTLFEMSVGRSDFPTGSARELVNSIKEKLFVLPDSVKVYPGHGAATDIGFEKANNMFV